METWELVLNLRDWVKDPGKFFNDITNLLPTEFQESFLRDMADWTKKQYILISAGRGTGKTFILALLTLWYIYVLPKFIGRPVKVVVLGGSEQQAKNLYNYIRGWIHEHDFIKATLEKDTMTETILKDGSSVQALAASAKRVRSPRGDILIIDEAVETDPELIHAAMGINIASSIARTIISSTPHSYNSLFVDFFNNWDEYGFEKPYIWSGLECPWVGGKGLSSRRKLLTEGQYRIEIEGIPYAFTGHPFPAKLLKECTKNIVIRAEKGDMIMGVDWGHYPAPTVCIVIQRIFNEEKKSIVKVLFTKSALNEKFEKVLDDIEHVARSYNVKSIYVDSIPPGEGARLKARGLPVYAIKFKGEKPMMISNLQALVENTRLEIFEEDYALIRELVSYRFDTKKGDDFVDALMLACRPIKATMVNTDLSELIFIHRASGISRAGLKGQRIARERARKVLEEVKSENVPKDMCTVCGKYPMFAHDRCLNCMDSFLSNMR